MNPLSLIIPLVALVLYVGKTAAGKKVYTYLPAPFWVYFLSIVLGSLGWLPQKSPLYGSMTLYVLPAALFLLLVGTPIRTITKLGPKALLAMGLATTSMFLGILISFIIFGGALNEEGWRMAGTMLGTWTGGSANMAAVKELVNLSDAGMAPLILVDTFLSYGWLALLVVGAGFQIWFDKNAETFELKMETSTKKAQSTYSFMAFRRITVLLIGITIAYCFVMVARPFSDHIGLLSLKAWAILLTSLAAVVLSLTPLHRLEDWDASSIGTFLLYCVLATYGAKTNFQSISGVWPYFLFAFVALGIHGLILFGGGRLLKLPLFLLATASQANVGGPVSAPIVAGVYKPGFTHVGVLMAILGAVLGTYIGAFGAWICKIIR